MDLTTIVHSLPLILSIAAVVVGGLCFGWFKIIKETNALLKEQNAELKIANAELLSKHNESLSQLASMQGQIDILKSIPLVNIDTTLQEIAKFTKAVAEGNDLILRRLEISATALASNTQAAVTAAEEVKQDLKSK